MRSQSLVSTVTPNHKPKTNEELEDVIPWGVWKATFLIGTQSFTYGYVLSAIGSTLQFGDDHNGTYCNRGEDSTCDRGTIYKDINLSDVNAQSLNALIFVGGFLGVLLAYYPAEKFGRRWTLLANTILVFFGCLFSAVGNVGCLYFGRFVSGLSLGVISIIAPILLAEICQERYRGVITTVHEVFVALGLFSSIFFGKLFLTYVDHGWQYIQAFGFLPSIILLAFYKEVPESPKWLLLHETTEQFFDNMAETLSISRFSRSASSAPPMTGAPSVVNPLATGGGLSNATHDSTPEFRSTVRTTDTTVVHQTIAKLRTDEDRRNIDLEIRMTLAEVKEDTIQLPPWKEILQHPKPLIIGAGLFFFNAACGISNLLFYSWNLFELEGFTLSVVGSAVFALTFLAMTVTSSRLIDSTGRRSLLIIGTSVMLIGLLVAGPILVMPGSDPVFGAIMSLLGMMGYSAGFGLGIGTVIWPIMSEIVPTRLRITASTFFLLINWLTNIIVVSIELSFVYALGAPKDDEDDDAYYTSTKIGVGWLFVIYGFIVFFGLIFIYIWIPETRNKTADQIDRAAMPLIDGRPTKADIARQNAARETATARTDTYIVS